MMYCNCKICEVVLGIIILVFTFWQTAASPWIVGIAAIVLIIHAFTCKACMMCAEHGKMMMKGMSKKKKQ